MKLLLLTAALVISVAASAQHSLFKPWEAPASPSFAKNVFARVLATPTDSSVVGWSAIASLVVQAYPGGKTLAGTGVSYGKKTYTYSSKTWYANWSVGALVYAGGAIVPSTPNAVIAAGLNFSVLNNRLSVGGAWDFVGKQPLLTIGTTISVFNTN